MANVKVRLRYRLCWCSEPSPQVLNRGLCVWAGMTWHSKNCQKRHWFIYAVWYFNFEELEVLFKEQSPPPGQLMQKQAFMKIFVKINRNSVYINFMHQMQHYAHWRPQIPGLRGPQPMVLTVGVQGQQVHPQNVWLVENQGKLMKIQAKKREILKTIPGNPDKKCAEHLLSLKIAPNIWRKTHGDFLEARSKKNSSRSLWEKICRWKSHKKRFPQVWWNSGKNPYHS